LCVFLVENDILVEHEKKSGCEPQKYYLQSRYGDFCVEDGDLGALIEKPFYTLSNEQVLKKLLEHHYMSKNQNWELFTYMRNCVLPR
jgi:hypothetical protein